MPLGSSSAAPVIRPGPSCLSSGAECRRERRPGLDMWGYSLFLRRPPVLYTCPAKFGFASYFFCSRVDREGRMEDRMTRFLLTAALLCVAVPAIAQPVAPNGA